MVASSSTERKLLWHPQQENKFAVAGAAQITLYEWDSDQAQIRHLNSQNDLTHMKCFAWSPDRYYDDLVAVGNTTGKIDLIRLEAREPGSTVLARGPLVQLSVRNQRNCNALAFCDADPNYLAAGLDKVRGDYSLCIYDINTASAVLSVGSKTTTHPHSRTSSQLPRPDISRASDQRLVQQQVQGDFVSCLAFTPGTTSHLIAGISGKWLRVFDLRNPSGTTQQTTKAHHIAIDPFDPHRVGTAGDGIVNIWDSRKSGYPLLTFDEKDAEADGAKFNPRGIVSGLEFSREKRGMLAVMQKDARHVRFWDIQKTQPARDLSSRSPREAPNIPRRGSWGGFQVGLKPAPEIAQSAMMQNNIVLADTRKTKNFVKELSSFALVPGTKRNPLTCNVMVVNKEGDLELYAVHDTPKHAVWSARGDLVIAAGSACRVLAGFTDLDPPLEPWDIPETNTLPVVPLPPESRSGSVVRGRAKMGRPTFGRGDDDGFPALIALPKVTANLAATRPGATRNYSPSSIRNYRFDHGGGSRRVSPKHSEVHPTESRGRSKHSHHHKSATASRKPSVTAVNQLVSEDISMVMRSRVIRGYGLMKAQHNFNVTRDAIGKPELGGPALSELWAWINHSNDLLTLPTGRLNGFNFAHQGLLGIWEGFEHTPLPPNPDISNLPAEVPLPPPKNGKRSKGQGTRTPLPPDDFHGDFHAAVETIAKRRGRENSWKPPVATKKLVYRQLALYVCGWSLKDGDLDRVVERWEKEGKVARAACWLVFTRQYVRAVELLMRTTDETLVLISSIITSLNPHTGGENQAGRAQLRTHCGILLLRLQDPYLRAIITHLISVDWTEVLDDEALPVRERLAIAFQFLSDKALSSYLRRTADGLCAEGNIEGLLITGLTPLGMNILQNYVDHSGDIQTAAILSSFVCPSRFKDKRADRWLEAYRNLLDGFKLFHHRVAFDMERGKIMQAAVDHGEMDPMYEWAPRQILLRCNYCNKTINTPPAVTGELAPATSCPHCGRALPRCSVCLMSLSVVHDAQREHDLESSHGDDTFDHAIVLCQACRHGGHASHISQWFFGDDETRSHRLCPVADCECACADQM